MVEGVVWPAWVKSLSFGASCDQPLGGVEWPSSLECLSFRSNINEATDKTVWLATIQRLSFASAFGQSLDMVEWPATLHRLTLKCSVAQGTQGVVWFGSGTSSRTFSSALEQLANAGVRTASLQHFAVSVDSARPIDRVVWPTSLPYLTFGVCLYPADLHLFVSKNAKDELVW